MSSVVKRAARAILLDEEQRLLLIKQTKDDQPAYWTVPGGGVEPDDASVEEADRRGEWGVHGYGVDGSAEAFAWLASTRNRASRA